MPTNIFSPAVPTSAQDILLKEGTFYIDYGEAGQAILGATQGGSKLEIERVIEPTEYDGSFGYTKNLRKTKRFVARFIVNLLKLNYTTLAYGLPITVTDVTDADGTFKKIAFDIAINSGTVLDNLTYKGEKQDGTLCVITLENVLNTGNIVWEWNTKGEIVSEMTFTGLYAYATPTVPPLLMDENVSPPA